MGKIVKFCSSCDEGFAEKFGFCPNCAAPLEAFELNPLAHEAKAEDAAIEAPTPAPIEVEEASPLQAADETPIYDDGYVGDTSPLYAENADVIEEESERYEPSVTAPAFAAAVPDTVPAFQYDAPTYDSAAAESYEPAEYTREDDGGYYITVIEEKNGKQRNLLLLGSFFLMSTLAVGGTVVSLFQKDLGIGAIGDERSLAYLIEEVPIPEVDEPKKDNKEEDGGGGGGGKEEPEPVNQGDLPPQQKNPIRPPDPKVYRSDNFELKTPPPSTEGNQKPKIVYNQWGDPNSRFANLSNGPGSGGGMGTGIGTGAGSGRGTGQGSGSGSGSGSGDGSGNGGGSGSGSGDRAAPPPVPKGVTTALRIISKPRAQYTDAGRTNSVQGVVRLKVTLLASGQIGSITPISRLPHGMTEQAIAAARQIRFEPKKVNGVPISVVQTVEYTFSLY